MATGRQLDAWKTILSSSDSIGQSHSTERPALIRRCINDLDASGFSWTRDSIEDALLRIDDLLSHASGDDNGPDCPSLDDKRSAVDPLNSQVRTHVLQRPSGLLDMPIEVLEQIVAEVSVSQTKFNMQFEVAELFSDDRYLVGQKKPVNTFHALASVNHLLHKLCVPWIWERLDFPQSHAPLSLWTEGILLRHGSHVRGLAIKFPDFALEVPGHMSNQADLPNHKYSYSSSGPNEGGQISAQDIVCILDQCPNLIRLQLVFPDVHELTDAEKEANWRLVQLFVLHFTPSLSRLFKLRDLTIYDPAWLCSSQQVTVPLITHLPLLESVTCRNYSGMEETKDCRLLGYYISKLKNLKKLSLYQLSHPNVFSSWRGLSGPLSLADVSFDMGVLADTEVLDLLRNLNQIAPNLTKLQFSYMDDSQVPPSLDYQWETTHSLHLPHLTELSCCSTYIHILRHFTACKALQKLSYRCIGYSNHLLLLCNALNHNFWPALKFIELTCTVIIKSEEWAILEELCKHFHIQLKTRDRHYGLD